MDDFLSLLKARDIIHRLGDFSRVGCVIDKSASRVCLMQLIGEFLQVKLVVLFPAVAKTDHIEDDGSSLILLHQIITTDLGDIVVAVSGQDLYAHSVGC